MRSVLGRYWLSSINFQKKNKINIFPIQTEQASSIKDLLLWLFSKLICEQQSVFLSVSVCYKDERRKQTIFIMLFSQRFLPKL